VAWLGSDVGFAGYMVDRGALEPPPGRSRIAGLCFIPTMGVLNPFKAEPR